MRDFRFAFASMLAWVAYLLMPATANAGPLDAIWVGVPGTVTPTGSTTNERVSIRAAGVDVYGLPRYFVRITYRCGAGPSCTTPEIEARQVGLPRTPFSSVQYVVSPLPAPAPQPAFFFALYDPCRSVLGAESLAGAWLAPCSQVLRRSRLPTRAMRMERLNGLGK